MNPSVGGSVRQQKVGGLAALYLAAAFVVAMPYFLVFVKYPSVVDPAEKVALLVGNHDSMRVMYLITYVIFGVVLAVLALTVHARLKDGAPTLAQAATAVGLIWAVVLVASGMIFNAGVAAVVGLHGTDPAQAVAAWQAIEPVAQGLGGSGGELLGGLWVLLVSVAALRTGRLPKVLNWLGVAIGAAGVLSVVPALKDVGIGFGMLLIVWFALLGIACCARLHERLFRPASSRPPRPLLPRARLRDLLPRSLRESRPEAPARFGLHPPPPAVPLRRRRHAPTGDAAGAEFLPQLTPGSARRVTTGGGHGRRLSSGQRTQGGRNSS